MRGNEEDECAEVEANSRDASSSSRAWRWDFWSRLADTIIVLT
jgi:hypothetical protein